MFPRKRQRPNPLASDSAPVPVASQPSEIASGLSPSTPSRSSTSVVATALTTLAASASGSASPMPSPQRGQSDASAASDHPDDPSHTASKAVRKTRSWYGTWPRAPKPQPSTHVARETAVTTIMRAGHPPDFTRFSTLQAKTEGVSDPTESTQGAVSNNKSTTTHQQQTDSSESQPGPATNEAETSASEEQPASVSGSWLGWLIGTSTSEPVAENAMPDGDHQKKDKAANTTTPGSQASDCTGDQAQPPSTQNPAQTQSTGSWFGFWGSAVPPAVDDKADTATPAEAETESQKQSANAPPKDPSAPPSAGSTWAFWSRDTKQNEGESSQSNGNQGELAVIGDGSEAKPERADGARLDRTTADSPDTARVSSRAPLLSQTLPSRRPKRLRAPSVDLEESAAVRRSASHSVHSSKTARPASPASQLSTTPSKSEASNMLLPSFHGTYRMKENPSILKQIAQWLLRTQQPPAKHVFLTKEPPKIKKAVAIGVHGWFPAAYLRTVIGQPTGTSIRFMNHGADAIRKWAEAHGSADCEIEKIALEGDGKIEERVDNLWKLLLNWIDHIRQADFIMLACHSQGVPVGLMLIAKLIKLGVVSNAKIGICAMAGVCLGPFADYKSGMGMFMSSAAELWEFGDPDSDISKRLERALQVVLNFGGRITFVGSIDDQVVPLESAIYSPAVHPYIFRAAFIDGQLHASDFIAQLVGFALKLRNLGITDHGLIRELSLPLAGSLYSGEGHSRLYDEQQVYDLAVVHALETTDLTQTPCHFEKRPSSAKPPNPYILPWIMRGLLEEETVKTELSSETAELLSQFDAWDPSTKALKDVKFRLEAIRSKL